MRVVIVVAAQSIRRRVRMLVRVPMMVPMMVPRMVVVGMQRDLGCA
jgi:hypothetical protein